MSETPSVLDFAVFVISVCIAFGCGVQLGKMFRTERTKEFFGAFFPCLFIVTLFGSAFCEMIIGDENPDIPPIVVVTGHAIAFSFGMMVSRHLKKGAS